MGRSEIHIPPLLLFLAVACMYYSIVGVALMMQHDIANSFPLVAHTLLSLSLSLADVYMFICDLSGPPYYAISHNTEDLLSLSLSLSFSPSLLHNNIMHSSGGRSTNHYYYCVMRCCFVLALPQNHHRKRHANDNDTTLQHTPICT